MCIQTMFGNKKYTLPPRPKPPDANEILDDLKNAKNNDVAFTLLARESVFNDSFALTEINNSNKVYEKVKTYLDINKKLKVLKDSIRINEQQLQIDVKSLNELTEEIKKQAQAALLQ